MLPPGLTTPGRGRRQLPQTPLTPRPGVAYKTPPTLPSTALTTGYQTRFSRGLSEHERLLGPQEESPRPVTRISSDPSLSPQRQGASHREDTEDFRDTVSTHATGRPNRTTPTASNGTSATGGGVPNGYHFTLGVNSAPSPTGRGMGSLRDREDTDWC